MRKKIILTVTTDLSYDQRMQRIAETLSTDFDVTLVGRKKKKSIPLPEKLPYRTVRLNTLFESGKGFYLLYNLHLFLYLIFKKVNILTAVDLDTIPACYLAARLRRVRLGFDAHEWFTELPELNSRPVIKRIWQRIERWFVPRADFAYTVNHSISNLYESRFGKKFSVVRNMPTRTLEKFTEKQSNLATPKIILYQGVLNVGRGLELMIDAIDTLEDYELHLAGEGDLSMKLRNQAANNRNPNKVVFHGYLQPAELKQLTSKAWIGINLLENISLNYYYSLANKFFDYVQAGIPQITMNYPEYESLNADIEVAILLYNTTVEDILVAVSKAKDPSYYNLLQENCRIASNTWCWENESSILKQIYQNQMAK